MAERIQSPHIESLTKFSRRPIGSIDSRHRICKQRSLVRIGASTFAEEPTVELKGYDLSTLQVVNDIRSE
jgi:hypothetical protein